MKLRPGNVGVLFAAVVAAGAGVLTWSGLEYAASGSLALLMLLGAAVVLAELVQVPGDERSLDPLDAHPFSLSSGIHVAAAIVAGPFAAAIVAAFGILSVDTLRGARARSVAFNASAFAVAAAAGGFAFELAGGTPGQLDVPFDFLPAAAVAAAYFGTSTALVAAIIAASTRKPLPPLLLDKARGELFASSAETAVGVAVALSLTSEPWEMVALVPLLLSVYVAKRNLARLRSETARALETFANVVDERDPYTYRHSARVADYVEELADALGLPLGTVARLRWAGRLHDLGKISVDAAVLRKPGRLDDDEWTAMRRHPRLSARILRRFRFSSGEARAVEYHHERYDGGGYYGVGPDELPLAAHFLVVADSYDAMTSDRPYRQGLAPEVALAEIEAGAGRQFHPAVAKAFVALRRGENPVAALDRAELDELRHLSLRRRGSWRACSSAVARRLEIPAAGGLILALAGVGAGATAAAVAGAAVAGALGVWMATERRRVRLLSVAIGAVAEGASTRDELFDGLVRAIARSAGLGWAGLVAWSERRVDGAVELERSSGFTAPSEIALTSWLVREADGFDDVVVTAGAELGGDGTYVAVPLRSGASVLGYVVLAFPRDLPVHVERALRAGADELGRAFARARPPAEPAVRRLAAVS